eukprot:s604_g9.t2
MPGVQRLTRTHIAEVLESKKLPRFDRVDWISDEKVVCVFKDAQAATIALAGCLRGFEEGSDRPGPGLWRAVRGMLDFRQAAATDIPGPNFKKWHRAGRQVRDYRFWEAAKDIDRNILDTLEQKGTKRDAPTGEDAIAAAVYANELGEAPRKKRRKNKGPLEEEEAPDLLQQMAQKDRELMALKEEVQPEDTPMEGADGPGTEVRQPEAAEAETAAPAAPAAAPPSAPAAVDTGEGEAISAVCDVVPQEGVCSTAGNLGPSCQIEVMARAFGHDDRIRIRWIVRLTPLADVSVCILAHLIASFADVYPIPVSPATVCVPGCWISTPQVRSFVKFNFANWASWPSQFVIFAVSTVKFPAMSEQLQALSTMGISLIIAAFGWIMQRCGDRMGLPRFRLIEVKRCMFFISLFCSATVMSSVKSIKVVFVIAALDAGKGLAITAQLPWELVQALEEEDGLYGPSEEDPAAAPTSGREARRRGRRTATRQPEAVHWMAEALAEASTQAQSCNQSGPQAARCSRTNRDRNRKGDAYCRHLPRRCSAAEDLDTLLGRLSFDGALRALGSRVVHDSGIPSLVCGWQPDLFRTIPGGDLNRVSRWHSAIEVVVILGLQIWLLRMFGINLWEFTGTLIRIDYSFSFFAMSACLVAFLAISIEHFGSWGLMRALDEQSAVSVICSVLESRPELAPSVVSFSVPDLTYPPIKALVERRSDGFIKSFNTEKGFGFIACEELYNVFGNDVFLVGQQMGSFNVGDEVSFAVALNKDNKPQAYDLRWQHHRNVASGKGGVKGAWQTPQQNQHQQQWGGGKSKGSGGGSWGKGSWQPKAAPSQVQEAPTYQAWKPAEPQQQPSWKKRKSDDAFEPPSEAVIGNYSGFIKSFNPSNGYGFIVCQDLKAEGYTNDVFLHHAQFEAAGLQVGNECEFTVFLNNQNKPQAKDLRPLGGWQ